LEMFIRKLTLTGELFFMDLYLPRHPSVKPTAMAEITSSDKTARTGVKRMKRLSTRVDLTPMVDLGFLLITFFIFTTTMSSSKAMNLVMPDDRSPKHSSKYQDIKTLTFLLDEGNRVYYYTGIFNGSLQQTDYKTGIRSIITETKKWLEQQGIAGNELLVLIKPSEQSSFNNLVDVLDEMLINDVRRYMIVDLSNEEQRKHEQMRQ
jgi:biopolymer transport protein ExbD